MNSTIALPLILLVFIVCVIAYGISKGPGHRGLLTVFFVGISLIVYSWSLLMVEGLIMNTDWRSSTVYENLHINGFLCFFFAVPMGVLFALGYLVVSKCFRRSRRWVVSSVLPVLLGVVILGNAIRYRLDLEAAFREILGFDLPLSARQLSHSYEGTLLEVYIDISFVADRDDLLKLLEELGLEPDPSLGRQYSPSVLCDGDNASSDGRLGDGRGARRVSGGLERSFCQSLMPAITAPWW